MTEPKKHAEFAPSELEAWHRAAAKSAPGGDVAALNWLNNGTDTAFYLVKVEAVRIGESPAAPLLTVIVGSCTRWLGRLSGPNLIV